MLTSEVELAEEFSALLLVPLCLLLPYRALPDAEMKYTAAGN